ncbi:hypothetical protein EKE94_06530 [Mesobaculum littorinae]|uniref:Oxidoreductase molybdopterin-binding domain-containing protein n=1 Tax=Mesobaculum littorinae TaxID=2486419 RepID=A0A438AIR3_9RHOB|nr:molybdopterin-dependent oxidoreductase [Mesobaculum littorinae]RVV98566.1 hypothetical protein EKE94_06530 [Mesobaculum littorinae]
MKQVIQACVFILTLAAPALALAGPQLTVTTADGEARAYERQDLLEIEAHDVTTDNDYIDGTATFTGPRLSTLLQDAGLKPDDQLQVTALNDYRTIIPAHEVLDYDVIIAVLMDGEEMSVRDKGPFWVIYPMSDHAELQEPSFNDRLIWQLSEIQILP